MRLLLLLLLPFSSFAQKIVLNETDKFTHQHHVQTDAVKFKSKGIEVFVSFERLDTANFVSIASSSALSASVPEGTKALFLLDDNTTATMTATGENVAVMGYYTHRYHISKSEMEKIAQHNTKSIRKYLNVAYADFDVTEKAQAKIKDLATLFLNQ